MRFDVVPCALMVPIMGEAVRGFLSHGQRGKVLAAVTHATYLLTEKGELVWLAASESPLHRRCIRWPAPLPRLAVDSIFSVRGHSITLAGGAKIDLLPSQVWEPAALALSNVISIKELTGRLVALYALLHAREKPEDCGSFILPVLQMAYNQDSCAGFQPENILTRKMWPIVERIARACLSHNLPGVLKQADSLIGLGEGLTPSGDDFVGGLFFARYLLACSYPHLDYLQSSNLPEWIRAVQPRTNQISYALLKDNVAGHALDPLNRFGVALVTNLPVESASSAASELIKVGHSTGWSMLTGFLVGMLLAFPDQLCISRF
jgi:Protein of unknown function (DUF2877)